MSNQLYALSGQFETPDEIMHAAEEVNKKYKQYDVNTPYPVHGMDGAMGMGESPIGWVTLVVGTTCMLLMLCFIAWIQLVDYPTTFAGKPDFNLPGYVPILFETTILTGAVTTVLTLLFVVCGLPNNAHPIHDTNYAKRTSDDRFGIYVEAKDPAFNEAEVRQLFEQLGAKDIAPIYIDAEEVAAGKNMSVLKPQFIGFAATVVLVISGAAYFGLNHMVFLPPYNWMSVQPKVVPQKTNTVFKNGVSMQLPVEGTIARGFIPYAKVGAKEGFGQSMANPLDPTAEVFALGEQKYLTMCSACHGNYGQGDSRLNGQYPAPPSLHSKKAVEWADAEIYHVITNGQNIMPSYAKQLTRDERWAIVHYVRALQRSLNPKETDVQ
jgi:mono/diheme cytochrome c family protein